MRTLRPASTSWALGGSCDTDTSNPHPLDNSASSPLDCSATPRDRSAPRTMSQRSAFVTPRHAGLVNHVVDTFPSRRAPLASRGLVATRWLARRPTNRTVPRSKSLASHPRTLAPNALDPRAALAPVGPCMRCNKVEEHEHGLHGKRAHACSRPKACGIVQQGSTSRALGRVRRTWEL
jgi:hypothetical protein